MINTILMCPNDNFRAALPRYGDNNRVLTPRMNKRFGFYAIVVSTSFRNSRHDCAKQPIVRRLPICGIIEAIMEFREVFQVSLHVGLVEVMNKCPDFFLEEDSGGVRMSFRDLVIQYS